jgi:hypothetical protein
MESHALHGDGIYYESGDRLWVNFYAPSVAKWESAGVQLAVDTDFPEGESARLTLTVDSPKAFTLALRRPAWAGDAFSVTVNGTAVEQLPSAGTYVELKRTWKTGDTVALRLPKSVRLNPIPDNQRRAAIMWGPLVLAGDLGPEPPRGGAPDSRELPPDPPVLVAAGRPPADWLKPVPGKPGSFRTDRVGRDRDVELVPFYRLHHRTYAAYWDVLTRTEYDKRVAEIAAERERQRKLEQATVAFVAPGDVQAERAANQQGEDTSIVHTDGRPGRRAGKWFAYDVPVDATRPVALVVTYNSDARRARRFEILVEGQRLAEQTIPESSESRFFDVEYPIPAEIVGGRERANVRFQAGAGSETAPVFGVRVIRVGG